MDLETLRVIIDATMEPLKKEMNKAKIIIRQSTAGMQKDMDSVRMKSSLSKDAENQMAKVRGMMSQIRDMAKQPMLEAGILIPTDQYMELSERVESAKSELEELQTVQNNMNPAKASRVSQDYLELQECIKESKASLDELVSKQKEWDSLGISKSEGTYRELRSQIEETKNTLEAFESEERSMLADGSDKAYSAEWQNIQRQIDAARAKLAQYQNQKAGMQLSGNDVSYATRGLSNGSYLQMGASVIKQQMNSAKAYASSATAEIKAKITETIQSIPLIGRAATESAYIGSRAFKGMKAVLSTVKPVIQKASGVFGSLIQKMKNGIGTISRFGQNLRSTGNHASGLGQKLGGLANMVKFMIGSMAVMAAFTAMKEGFGNLAQYSSRANANISSLMNSLTQLKNSLAAAFAPILNVVTPILDTFIGYLVGAINAVGQFFAAITGQSTYIKAYKGAADYAAGMNNVAAGAGNAAGATKDATSAAEKYKKTLMGFDQINALNDQDASSGNGSGGGSGGSGAGGSGGGDLFYTETVSNGMTNLAQMIKDAWAKADFTEIGTMLGEKLNAALESIPWEKIQATCNKIAKSIATFLNGFIEAVDWELVGWTISEGLNTAFGAANTFAVNFHWDSLGKAVGDGINGALGNLDWTLIRTTVKNIVGGITESLNTMIQTTNWGLVGDSFGQAVNTVIDGSYTAVTTFDWSGLGTAIYQSVNRAIETIDWSKAGTTISEGAKGILDSINTALEGIDWKQLGQQIGEFLTSIDWLGILADVGTLIANALIAVIDLAGGLFEAVCDGITKMKWSDVADTVGKLFNAALKLKDTLIEVSVSLIKKGWETLTKFVGNAVEAAITLTKQGWTTVSEWVKGFIGGTLSAVVSLTGKLAGKAWKTIETVTDNLKKAAKKKVYKFTAEAKGDWKTLKGYVKDVVAKIKDKTAKFTAKAKGSWDSLTEKAKGLLKNIKDKSATYKAKSSGPWSTIAKNAKDTYNNVKNKTATFKAVASGAWDKISKVLNQAKKWMVNKVISWKIKIPHIKLPHLIVGETTKTYFGKKWKIPTLNVKYYAKGGFPQKGQMFIANEAGPEMIGTMGGRTTVANNNQITAGIASAVYPAVYNAVIAALARSGGNGSQPINIYIGDKQITEYFIEYVKRQTKSTGRNPVFV